MSQENVEIVRRWFAAIAEGELASDLWDADLNVDNIPEFPVTGRIGAMRACSAGGMTWRRSSRERGCGSTRRHDWMTKGS